MMNQLKYGLVFGVTLACCITPAAADLTQSWYSIAFDLNGNKTDITYNHPVISDTVVTSLGDGYNGTWYYYPALDRYIMWFHNGPYSASQKGYYEFLAFFGGINGSQLTSYDMAFGYTTPEWTLGSNPPLPDNINTQSIFNLYTHTAYTSYETGRVMSSSSREVNSKNTIDQYNPEWFFVSAQGQNVVIYRYLLHGLDDSPTTQTQGACCNHATGDCYITTTGSCAPGYTYLGDNSTCSACTTQQPNLDFGDAPSSYKIRLVNNGARHYLVQGIRLGQTITGESDGQASQNANLDAGDDGVKFETALVVGQNTNIKVTASTLGAINAWLDLNGDGDWDDLQEQILLDEPVAGGTT
ncbi:MAG: hypothetical protein K9N55_07640, partial [Phycisphaerae bacterium]|nr:hypothetical protein [Phycisphaerae bacterium]